MNCYFCTKQLKSFHYCNDCNANTYYDSNNKLFSSVKMYNSFYICYNFYKNDITIYNKYTNAIPIMGLNINQDISVIESKVRMYLLFQ